MDGTERIRKLIEEGKISDDEGLQLVEACERAEARDRIVREELRQARARRRSAGAWAAVNLGLLGIVLLGLVFSLVVLPGLRAGSAEDRVQLTEELLSQDLDLMIQRLERGLRQPGRGPDYRLLGMAYEMRYRQTGEASDRQRAAEALARADRLERRTSMKGNPAVFGTLFVLVIVTAVVVWVMLMYNSLTRRDERVDERWAQVEAMLQRRLDLIPPLVDAVRGYAAHERQTLLEVTEARAKLLGILEATEGNAPRSPTTLEELDEAQAELRGALRQLVAVAENYPDLKASINFVTLQDQLEGTENRIAVERQRYNDAVRQYNSRLRVFPVNVVGGMFGFESREYFESRLGAEEPVPLNL